MAQTMVFMFSVTLTVTLSFDLSSMFCHAHRLPWKYVLRYSDWFYLTPRQLYMEVAGYDTCIIDKYHGDRSKDKVIKL